MSAQLQIMPVLQSTLARIGWEIETFSIDTTGECRALWIEVRGAELDYELSAYTSGLILLECRERRQWMGDHGSRYASGWTVPKVLSRTRCPSIIGAVRELSDRLVDNAANVGELNSSFLARAFLTAARQVRSVAG